MHCHVLPKPCLSVLLGSPWSNGLMVILCKDIDDCLPTNVELQSDWISPWLIGSLDWWHSSPVFTTPPSVYWLKVNVGLCSKCGDKSVHGNQSSFRQWWILSFDDVCMRQSKLYSTSCKEGMQLILSWSRITGTIQLQVFPSDQFVQIVQCFRSSMSGEPIQKYCVWNAVLCYLNINTSSMQTCIRIT